VNFAHAGMGSAPHLGGVLFNQLAGANLTPIPVQGRRALGAVGDRRRHAGDLRHAALGAAADQGRAAGGPGRDHDRALPAGAGAARHEGVGPAAYKIDFWYGFFVPAGTPPEIVKKLFDATQVALQKPEVKAALAREGTDVSASASPADFARSSRRRTSSGRSWRRDSGRARRI
jgi:hypothetical protein